jgi:hypothetical protein
MIVVTISTDHGVDIHARQARNHAVVVLVTMSILNVPTDYRIVTQGIGRNHAVFSGDIKANRVMQCMLTYHYSR